MVRAAKAAKKAARIRKKLQVTIASEERAMLDELANASGAAIARVVGAAVRALYETDREEAIARIETAAVDVRGSKKSG